jgi:hypothetical protein
MTTLPEIIGAFVSDAFELTGTHGGSVAGAIIGRYFRRRTEQARDILFEELRQANISNAQAASEDDAIAVIVRYLRAAREGAARLNLRLLAKVIAGQLRSGRLVADEFLQYADILSSLTHDEIVVIGTIYSMWGMHQKFAATDPTEAAKYADPWQLTVQKLTGSGSTEDGVLAAAAKAQRSGLIYGMAAAPPNTGTDLPSALVYRVSPILIELGRTVDFLDALRQETSPRE